MHQASGSYSQSMKRLEKSIYTPTCVRCKVTERTSLPSALNLLVAIYKSGWRNETL